MHFFQRKELKLGKGDISKKEFSSVGMRDFWGSIFQFLSFNDIFKNIIFVSKLYKNVVESHVFAISNFEGFVNADLPKEENYAAKNKLNQLKLKSRKKFCQFHEKYMSSRASKVESFRLGKNFSIKDVPSSILKQYTGIKILRLVVTKSSSMEYFGNTLEDLNRFDDSIKLKKLQFYCTFFESEKHVSTERSYGLVNLFSNTRKKGKINRTKIKSLEEFSCALGAVMFLRYLPLVLKLQKLTKLKIYVSKNCLFRFPAIVKHIGNLKSVQFNVSMFEAFSVEEIIKKTTLLYAKKEYSPLKYEDSKNFFPKLTKFYLFFGYLIDDDFGLLEKLLIYFQNTNSIQKCKLRKIEPTSYFSGSKSSFPNEVIGVINKMLFNNSHSLSSFETDFSEFLIN